VPAYDLAGVRPSVVHIGPGVFHRAHQAVYSDEVLATGSGTGGICAISLRSADLHRALARQGHLYALLERGDVGDRARLIGSIRETVVAAGDPEAALRRLTDPAVQVVTITVPSPGTARPGPVVEAMLRHEVVPTLAPPPGLDLPAYAATVLRRFANRPLAYATAKVAGDGSQKLSVRILGTVADRLAAGAGMERLALVVAAWAACVLGPRSGEFAVRDPELDRLLGSPGTPVPDAAAAVDRLLGLDAVFGPLGRTPAFAGAVRRHAATLWGEGVHTVAATCR
jgi:mannitol-1-phosphate/altronate dehydrogenase